MFPSFRGTRRVESDREPGARHAPPHGQTPHGQTRSEPSRQAAEPIIFYSKTGCPWANAVRHLLDANGITYEERNARQERRFMDELVRETRQSFVPTLKIGGEWLVDTDARTVARHLGLPEPAHVLL